MKFSVTTNSQEAFFHTNDLDMAIEAAMNYADRHACSTFVWRKGQTACTYFASYKDGSATLYRGRGRKY